MAFKNLLDFLDVNANASLTDVQDPAIRIQQTYKNNAL